MWIHPVRVKKNVQTYISPKLCLMPEIKSKYFRTGECVGIGQTTVLLYLQQYFYPRSFHKSWLSKKKKKKRVTSKEKLSEKFMIFSMSCENAKLKVSTLSTSLLPTQLEICTSAPTDCYSFPSNFMYGNALITLRRHGGCSLSVLKAYTPSICPCDTPVQIKGFCLSFFFFFILPFCIEIFPIIRVYHDQPYIVES